MSIANVHSKLSGLRDASVFCHTQQEGFSFSYFLIKTSHPAFQGSNK